MSVLLQRDLEAPESGFNNFTPQVRQQIGMSEGSRFELASLNTGDLLQLHFIDNSQITLETLYKPEIEKYPNEFNIITSSFHKITSGLIMVNGATNGGTIMRPAVLQRWSNVNLNMIIKYRLDSLNETNFFAKDYKKLEPHFGKDDEGYYLNAIRWPGGINTPELSQVYTLHPGETEWINQFL